MKSIPKTSAGFEKDYHQLEKDSGNVYQYLKNIPLKTLEGLFKNSEVEAELLSGVLEAFVSHGLANADSSKHAAEFLLSLSKAKNYDMTLMFVDEAEKEKIKKISDAVKKQCADQGLLARFNKVYFDA